MPLSTAWFMVPMKLFAGVALSTTATASSGTDIAKPCFPRSSASAALPFANQRAVERAQAQGAGLTVMLPRYGLCPRHSRRAGMVDAVHYLACCPSTCADAISGRVV